MNWTEGLGYVAAFFVLMTFSMKTMVQLRSLGIVSNVFFIAYGYLHEAYPILGLHSILLPLNSWRLWQIVTLVRKVGEATRGDPDLDWIASFTNRRTVSAGERRSARRTGCWRRHHRTCSRSGQGRMC